MPKFEIKKRSVPVVDENCVGEGSGTNFAVQPLSEPSPTPVSTGSVPVVESLPVVSVQSSGGMSADDAKSFLGALKGRKVTLDENIRDLQLDDEHLGMKTENNDPIALSIWELIGDRAEAKGYHKTAQVYRMFAHNFKVNMVSYKRGSRKEMENIYTARRQREDEVDPHQSEGSKKMLGERSR